MSGNILLKRLGLFDEVVSVVVFLVSEGVVYMIGCDFIVDGGK